MFISENDHKNDLNLFYYMNHICLIKDLTNAYLEMIKTKIKNIFVFYFMSKNSIKCYNIRFKNNMFLRNL